jgi:hypothetical protein
MKDLSRLLLAPTVAAALLLALHRDECRASRRRVGLRRDLECGAVVFELLATA